MQISNRNERVGGCSLLSDATVEADLNTWTGVCEIHYVNHSLLLNKQHVVEYLPKSDFILSHLQSRHLGMTLNIDGFAYRIWVVTDHGVLWQLHRRVCLYITPPHVRQPCETNFALILLILNEGWHKEWHDAGTSDRLVSWWVSCSVNKRWHVQTQWRRRTVWVTLTNELYCLRSWEPLQPNKAQLCFYSPLHGWRSLSPFFCGLVRAPTTSCVSGP